MYDFLGGIDGHISEALADAPFALAVTLALLLGLRHASDPDHLIAVMSLITTDGAPDIRAAVGVGTWWGVGHASTLLVIGLPLMAMRSRMPAGVESGAELAVGVMIVALGGRAIRRSAPSGYGAWTRPRRRRAEGAAPRVVLRGRRAGAAECVAGRPARTSAQAFAVGVMHGTAGTGVVVVALAAALPDRLEAMIMLAAFAPMSVISMSALTGGLAWLMARNPFRKYGKFLFPAVSGCSAIFGIWFIANCLG